MTAPDRSTLGVYGGPWTNYGDVIDPETDIDAKGGNEWATDTASMLRTAPRAWLRFTPAGTGTPTLQTHFEHWPTSGNAAPIVARVTTGLYTATYPVTVVDELTENHTLNLLAGDCQCESQSALWRAQVSASGNVVSIALFNSSGSLADPSGPIFFLKAF